MVIYNDKVYQCVKGHTSIDTWAPSIWTRSLWVKVESQSDKPVNPDKPDKPDKPVRTMRVVLEIDLDTGKVINANSLN